MAWNPQCRRHRVSPAPCHPAEGGIVERSFGTLNREFFSTLPGYTTANAKPHLASINAEACLSLEQLEGLLVRYIVDNYNQQPDARDRQHNWIERWRAGQMAQGNPPDGREPDLLLMRHRSIQGGYLRFANLVNAANTQQAMPEPRSSSAMPLGTSPPSWCTNPRGRPTPPLLLTPILRSLT